jgi:hypothetical protein
VNCTDCPTAGAVGLFAKETVDAVLTLTSRVALVAPAALLAVNVTAFDPAVA